MPSPVTGITPERLVKLGLATMPFGKYSGRLIIDCPEAYLLWFLKKGEFPNGELGQLMQLALELKVHGLEQLITPLKSAPM